MAVLEAVLPCENTWHFLLQAHVLQESLSTDGSGINMPLPSVSPPGSPFLARADSDILPPGPGFPDRSPLQTGDETR